MGVHRLGSIDAQKRIIRNIFKDFWFVIPEYQRSYVWDSDNITDLLDDLWFAFQNKPESEYFLGSLVLRDVRNEEFAEYEVLDGQQRLTTLMMLFAVIRDLSTNPQLIGTYHGLLYQEENVFEGVPERVRIVYKIRDKVEGFIREFLLLPNGTKQKSALEDKQNEQNLSIQNMANAILTMHSFFKEKPSLEIVKFAQYVVSKIVMIYVSTDNREDAFRLFTILNNRGIPLTNADILKSINIGAIPDERENKRYALLWEKIESSLGEDFDRFLSFVRTILVKEKARTNLLEEYEENIYYRGLLQKGKETVDLIHKYKQIYDGLIKFEFPNLVNEYKNLVTIMNIGLPSGDWIPPLLHFYYKFGSQKIVSFLSKLEYKFSGDWIAQLSPTERIENMNRILKIIDSAQSEDTVLSRNDLFSVDQTMLIMMLNNEVYGRRFARYVLLKYEYFVSDHTVHLSDYKNISVEHVLPQNPSHGSEWLRVFSNEDREVWTDRLANLVLISKRKNASLSNLDFSDKKERYLKSRIDIFTGSKIFIHQNSEWNIGVLETRQGEMIRLLTTQP